MQVPSITRSQKRIILYLASLRFLHISHLMSLFSHKDPHRIKAWLIDLEEKHCIAIIKDLKNRTKPYIICLNYGARPILEKDQTIDRRFLKRLYREKKTGETYIQRLLFLADCYLYFLKLKDPKTRIDFFTQQDLQGYTYFPDPMPDAYIDEQTKNGHTRYFLEYFEKNLSAKKLRFLVSRYFKYYDSESWPDNTDHAPFPAILLLFDSPRKKWHIYHYAKALLEKSLTSDMEIFLTTKDQILAGKPNADVWQQVDG